MKSIALFLLLLFSNLLNAQEAPVVDGVLVKEWIAGGADLTGNPIGVQLVNPQRLTFEQSTLGATKEVAPGAALTDIGLWQVQSNGAFSIKIESGAAPAGNYTPPTYPAFTKVDRNAAGREVAGSFDELPATFGLQIENIDSICIGNNCNDLPITYSVADRNAQWGPKTGADFEKDLNSNADNLLKVQVLDVNPGGDAAKVNIRLQAEIPDLSRNASIQPGIYTANLKITVAASQTAP